MRKPVKFLKGIKKAKNIYLLILVFALSACGGKEPSIETDTDSQVENSNEVDEVLGMEPDVNQSQTWDDTQAQEDSQSQEDNENQDHDKNQDDNTILLPYMPSDEDHPLYGVTPGPITDREVLNYLWNEYLGVGVASILNNGNFDIDDENFNSSMSLDLEALAEYAGRMYINKHGLSEFENTSDHYKYISMEKINPIIRRYFNMDEIDVNEIDVRVYDAEKDAVYINSTGADKIQEFDASNGWGLKFENVEMLEDGSIYFEINRYQYDSNVLDESFQVNLRPREDQSGEYYFAKAFNDVNVTNPVIITGDYERTDVFSMYVDENNYFQGELYYLGEDDDQIILESYRYGYSGGHQLVAFNKSDETVTHLFDLDRDNEYYSFSVVNDHEYGRLIKFTDKKNIKLFNFDMELEREIEVPESITSLMVDPIYSGDELEQGFFGYDISPDYNFIAYATEEGLFLYDRSSDSTLLLQERLPRDNDKFSQYAYLTYPKFVEGNNIIAHIPGYEWSDGYAYYNMDSDDMDVVLYASDGDRIVNLSGTSYYAALEFPDGGYYHNLKTGEKTPAADFLDGVSFAYIYSYDKIAYNAGITGLVIEERDYEDLTSKLSFFDQEEIQGNDLTLEGSNIQILFFYIDDTGEVQVFLNYSSQYNDRGVLKWHTGYTIGENN